MGFRFAHLSDCHIGGWREPELTALSIQGFTTAMELCIQRKVDFILIAGDLFNTSLPVFDALKEVARVLRVVQDAGIRVYLIPGSHDYSPSGKTMIDVLEKAGLCVNVFRFSENKLQFTVDQKTGVKLTGMVGLKGGLESFTYQTLQKENLERETGFKIFLFHSLIDEYKPDFFEQIIGEPLSSFPKGFSYYAGGHPHYVFQKKEKGYGLITYPGPLFPNNFLEMERLKTGGFYIVDDQLHLEHVPVMLKQVVSLRFSAEGKTPEQVKHEILTRLQKSPIKDCIVTLRVDGILRQGKPSDLRFDDIVQKSGAYCVLKNTAKLQSAEFETISAQTGTVEDIERSLLHEYASKKPLSFISVSPETFISSLIHFFDREKHEGETIADFERRLLSDVVTLFPVEGLLDDAFQKN